MPQTDRPRYRTRKGEVATNVLGVCDTKGDFIFVLAGWKGSAADSRILQDAIAQPNGLHVPQDNQMFYASNIYFLQRQAN